MTSQECFRARLSAFDAEVAGGVILLAEMEE